MSDVRRLVALLLAVMGLGVAAFGVVRGLTKTGPSHGVRMVVTITPPADAAVLAMAQHVVHERIDERDAGVRVVTAGEQLVIEIGDDEPERVDALAALLERSATLAVHVVDAKNPWLARLATAVAADPQAGDAGIRVDGGMLRADDRHQELALSEADAIGCTGRVEDGRRRCLVRGDHQLEAYLDGLVARDPSLVLPADRLAAYGRVDDSGTWRLYVLEQPAVLDGRAIRRAEALPRGVALDVAAAPRIEPGVSVAFVFDGRVKAVRTIDAVAGTKLHVLTTGATEDATIAAALELVTVIEAGAVPPLRVVKREPFTRATGFIPRAWPFLAVGAGVMLGGLLVWRRRRPA